MRACLLVPLLAASALAQTVDFEREVWPILVQHCVKCHGTSDVKGNLRLDGKGFILKGSGAGPVLEAGKPEDSTLWSLTVLERGDPDRMPKQGPSLSKAETELLRRWIEQGADFGTWTGTPMESAAPRASQTAPRTTSARVALYERLSEGLKPVPDATLLGLAKEGVRVTSALRGSPLLRVEIATREPLSKSALASLSALSSHIVVFDAARAKCDEGLLGVISKAKALVRVDLARTGVGPELWPALAAAKELRELNLYGAAIDDRAFERLPAWPALEVLVLTDTKVTEDAMEALKAKRPAVRIISGFDGPAPSDEPGAAPRRRRGD